MQPLRVRRGCVMKRALCLGGREGCRECHPLQVARARAEYRSGSGDVKAMLSFSQYRILGNDPAWLAGHIRTGHIVPGPSAFGTDSGGRACGCTRQPTGWIRAGAIRYR